MISNWRISSSPSNTDLSKGWNKSLTAICDRKYDRKKHHAHRLDKRFECRRVENVNLTHGKIHHLSVRHGCGGPICLVSVYFERSFRTSWLKSRLQYPSKLALKSLG